MDDPHDVRIYIDEDVHGSIGKALRNLGYDAVTAAERDRANKSIPDEQQLEYAVSEGRILVSFNVRDYCDLDEEWRGAGREHCGILVGPQRSSFQAILTGIQDAVARYQPDAGGYVDWF